MPRNEILSASHAVCVQLLIHWHLPLPKGLCNGELTLECRVGLLAGRLVQLLTVPCLNALAPLLVPRHVRRRIHLAHLGHKVLSIVALVGTCRHLW
jgi:hypothetical protein